MSAISEQGGNGCSNIAVMPFKRLIDFGMFGFGNRTHVLNLRSRRVISDIGCSDYVLIPIRVKDKIPMPEFSTGHRPDEKVNKRAGRKLLAVPYFLLLKKPPDNSFLVVRRLSLIGQRFFGCLALPSERSIS